MAHNNPDKANYIYNSQLVSTQSEPRHSDPNIGKDAFTLYHISNDAHSHSNIGPALPALGHATSGAAGTAISKLITYPLDLVITRLQAQRQLKRDGKHAHYTGILDAIETIYEREGGLQAFYSGLVPEIVKGVADSFLFFLAYSYVRQRRLAARDGGRSLPVLEEIGVGAIAGAFSKFWTTPLQQIVTRKQTAAMMQEDTSTGIAPPSSVRDIASQIMREKGIQGFWSGYSASLILTLNPSVTMLLHKILLRLIVPRSKRDDPGARLTFLLAATSKAMASTVTYPFSLAKTQAQLSSQKPTSTAGETSETEKPGSTVAQARQRTVFSTIVRIAETEGLGGLYQGLGAEVVKGFFSHGITMLMKDRIHTLIISLYYTVLKAMHKYPGPEELAKRASDGAKDLYEQGKEQASGAYEKGIEMAEQASERVKEAAVEGSQRASELMESGKQHASDAYTRSTQISEAASKQAIDLLERGKDMAGNVSQHTENVVESGKQHASDAYAKGSQLSGAASKQASDLLERGKDLAGSASQQTGSVVESGKSAVSNASGKAVGAGETGRDAAANVGQRVKQAVEDADVRDIDGPDTSIKE
jgi:hypothetical protein